MDMTYSVQLPYYDGTPETGVSGAKPLTGTHEGYYVARDPIGYLWGVTKASPNLDLAIRYLDYAFSDENQDMYCWGIEGESFEVDADGNRKFTEKASDSTMIGGIGKKPPTTAGCSSWASTPRRSCPPASPPRPPMRWSPNGTRTLTRI